jgi:hypothetical protein
LLLKRLSRCAPALLFAAALTGCVNLKAVHDFAAISTDGQTLRVVAAELADSPARQVRYASNEDAKKDLEAAAALGKKNARELVAFFGVVQRYLAALATLSSDGIVATNNELAGLTNEIAESTMFAANADATDAFGELSELVARAATDFYRRAELRRMIKAAAPHFPVAIGALQRVVTNDCVLQLQGELGALNQYYREQSGIADPAAPKWAVVLVEEVRQDRETAVRDKIQVCRQYGVVLGKIAAGHAALVKNLNHLDAKDLVSELEGYEQGIFDAYDAVRSLK